jgi:hypothetical protein
MDALVELSWRAYPAVALLVAGLGLMARGVRDMTSGLRRPYRPATYMAGFRAGVVGLAVAGIAGAWVWQQLWLLVLALAIGGEELLESSIALYALREGERRAAPQA